ncbi:zinc-binding metallopeptidase family protein [Flavobacterium piscinae]|uniref:hypothetical protein n=1 Tax=Flavobacterium piscinae TaxID=2506424 RepID=UPI002AABD945|nr:hypothetical protein [Flavobacterium piscinae]
MEENFIIERDKDQLSLKGYTYETSKSNLPTILPKIEQIINKSKYKDQFISVLFIQENPTVLNNDLLTREATNVLNNIFGNKTVTQAHGQIPYFNDDFCYFQQKMPGVYFLLGVLILQKASLL